MSDSTVDASHNRQLATQLYDMLMRDIEPDLLSYNIPKLDEYYADETTAEHDERMKRYERAYKDFDYVLGEFMSSVQDEVRTAKRSSLKEKETRAAAEDSNQLSTIEAAFSA